MALRPPLVRFHKTVPDCWIKPTIREGRNRQVRRKTAAVRFPALRLVRWLIGEWTIAGLGLGSWVEGESRTRAKLSVMAIELNYSIQFFDNKFTRFRRFILDPMFTEVLEKMITKERG